jgi:hypothetical protein
MGAARPRGIARFRSAAVYGGERGLNKDSSGRLNSSGPAEALSASDATPRATTPRGREADLFRQSHARNDICELICVNWSVVDQRAPRRVRSAAAELTASLDLAERLMAAAVSERSQPGTFERQLVRTTSA